MLYLILNVLIAHLRPPTGAVDSDICLNAEPARVLLAAPGRLSLRPLPRRSIRLTSPPGEARQHAPDAVPRTGAPGRGRPLR